MALRFRLFKKIVGFPRPSGASRESRSNLFGDLTGNKGIVRLLRTIISTAPLLLSITIACIGPGPDYKGAPKVLFRDNANWERQVTIDSQPYRIKIYGFANAGPLYRISIIVDYKNINGNDIDLDSNNFQIESDYFEPDNNSLGSKEKGKLFIYMRLKSSELGNYNLAKVNLVSYFDFKIWLRGIFSKDYPIEVKLKK
jgi:hypothetical protein